MAGQQQNVGYARPGKACLYNIDIMEETTHILALGAGGISKRVYEDEGHIGRAPNVANIEHYINRVDEIVCFNALSEANLRDIAVLMLTVKTSAGLSILTVCSQ